jgi:hypothetical protein
MTSRRLTKALKTEIQDKIETYVTKKITDSIPGKELATITKQLEEDIRALCLKLYPIKVMQLLKKYKSIAFLPDIRVFVEGTNKLSAHTFYLRSQTYYTVTFTPPIMVPYHMNNWYMISEINREPYLRDQLVFAAKTNEHLQCEIKETVAAYMERISQFTTEAKLLEAYPEYDKFLPTAPVKSTPRETKKARTILKEFEAA